MQNYSETVQAGGNSEREREIGQYIENDVGSKLPGFALVLLVF